MREKELGRPFSVISSNPKYNADYLEHIVKTKWLKKLNEMEMTNNDYVDAHCVGVDVDGNITVHWVALKSIGKTVFSNAVPSMPQKCRIIMISTTPLAASKSKEHSGNIFLRRTRHGQAQE